MKLKILIIDDSADDLFLLTHILKSLKYDFDIDSASNGREGINKVQESEYDLVFLDHQMFGMNGLDVITEIRTFNTTLKVIGFSSCNLSGFQKECLEAGMSAVFTKGNAAQDLKKLIDQFIFPEEI